MSKTDYYMLADHIHESLSEIKELRETIKQIGTMLDDINKKLYPLEKELQQELERIKEE